MGSNYCKYVTDGYTDNTTVPFALCPIHPLLSAKTKRFSVYQYYHVIVSQKGLFKHFFIYSCKVIPMISPILYNSRSACVCVFSSHLTSCASHNALCKTCAPQSAKIEVLFICAEGSKIPEMWQSRNTPDPQLVYTHAYRSGVQHKCHRCIIEGNTCPHWECGFIKESIRISKYDPKQTDKKPIKN